MSVQVLHTADLDRTTRGAARRLLDEAFEGRFSDLDWEHSLGGLHALVWDGGELVGHGSVVPRRLLLAGRAVRTGYVEGVGVRPDRRRRGFAAGIMAELERVIRAGYDLGALSASDLGAALYAGRGWQLWPGPTSVLTPHGVVRTPQDDGSTYVLPVAAELDRTVELTCDWRDGDVW